MKSIIKAFISIGLLVAVAYQLDWRDVIMSASRLQWWAPPAAIALLMATYMTGTFRWWLLLKTHGLGHRPGHLLPTYLIGVFLNQILPSTTGGDAWRIFTIYQERHGANIAVSPIVTERVIGLVCLLGIATAVLLFMDQTNEITHTLKRYIPPAFIVAVCGVALAASDVSHKIVHRLLAHWAHARLVAALLRIFDTGHRYLQNFKLLTKVAITSILMQITHVGIFIVLGMAINASIELADYLVMTPVIFILTATPITIGGLGIREVAIVTLYTAVGMAEADAAAIALFNILLLLCGAVPGLVLFLKNKNHKEIFMNATRSKIAG